MTITSIRTLQGLDLVRPEWEQWQRHTNQDLAQFELVCRLRPEVESPFVTVLERDGQVQALLIGRLERTTVSPAIGYLSPVHVPARVLAVLHEGVLGPMDEGSAVEAVRSLLALLRSGGADAVAFHHLAEQSPLLSALQREAGAGLFMRASRWSTHREMVLAGSGSFVQQKLNSKHRASFRKRQKALEAAFPGRVEWRWMTRFDDIDGLCARLEAVATRTYQRGLGAGFVDNDEHRQRFSLFARRGQLRVQLLEIDGSVRAFWYGTVYGGTFHSSETGYDPDLREFEVGTLMFIRMADALMDEGIRRLDFGIGDAPYKARFGDRSWREAPAWLFAPTAKGVGLMVALRAAQALDGAARAVLERAGWAERLKSAWRRRHSGQRPRSRPLTP